MFVFRYSFRHEEQLCTERVYSLNILNQYTDKRKEFLALKEEYMNTFVSMFQSNNGKLAQKMKETMKEVFFDHFQITEAKLSQYFEIANQKLDAANDKLDVSQMKLDSVIQKLETLEKMIKDTKENEGCSETKIFMDDKENEPTKLLNKNLQHSTKENEGQDQKSGGGNS